MKAKLRIGFVVNPFAGAGGPAALKGSDAISTRKAILAGQIEQTALGRAALFIHALKAHVQDTACLTFWTVQGDMGATILRDAALPFQCVPYQPHCPTLADDTRRAVIALCASKIDLLVFVGGDGTARDVCESLGVEGLNKQWVLGVPAGVKMQSAVYAVSPNAAAQVIAHMIGGELVAVAECEVRDLDEAAYVKGQVKSRYFGSLWVPDEPQFVQAVKQGGLEVEPLVISDIADQLKEWITGDTLVIMGPGSTTQQVAEQWGADKTLLGVDVFCAYQCVGRDLTSESLSAMLNQHAGELMLVLTVMGGQGHIVGRGNQQLSASILKRIGQDRTKLIATRGKLRTLEGRALLVDSGDPDLDKQWQGYMPVLTGYDEHVLYPVGYR